MPIISEEEESNNKSDIVLQLRSVVSIDSIAYNTDFIELEY